MKTANGFLFLPINCYAPIILIGLLTSIIFLYFRINVMPEQNA